MEISVRDGGPDIPQLTKMTVMGYYEGISLIRPRERKTNKSNVIVGEGNNETDFAHLGKLNPKQWKKLKNNPIHPKKPPKGSGIGNTGYF